MPHCSWKVAAGRQVAAAKAAKSGSAVGDALADALYEQALARWQTCGFYRFLNRMVFRAATPGDRFRIYQRFYRLRAPLIERFYAGRSTTFDKMRVLAGKPPVPIGRALRVLLET
jgi:lycopene beta-cyclase